MKAAVLHEVNQPLVIEEISVKKPRAREVLIKTAVAGLCHSDLHFMEGLYPHPLPAVLGHESAGVVEQVGSEVTHVQPGDHVVTCLSVFCGVCENCNTGRPALCLNTDVKMPPGQSDRHEWTKEPKLHTFLNLSSFAEQMLVHESALVKVRPDMPLDRAALIGCAVTTGFGAVANTARVSPGATVVVIGCGGVGLSAVNGASIIGAGRIIAVDVQQAKLDQARTVGATDLVDASTVDPVDVVLELTEGGADFTFEALGLRETVEQAFRMLSPGGVATVIGMVPEGQMVEVHAADLLAEKVLQGSNMGSNRFRVDMPYYADLYLEGRLKLDEITSRHIGLDGLDEAFHEMRGGSVGRSIVVFD